ESDPRQEEIDVVSVINDVLPPSDDDSDEEVNVVGFFPSDLSFLVLDICPVSKILISFDSSLGKSISFDLYCLAVIFLPLCSNCFKFALRNRVLLWKSLKIRVLQWTVLIDSSLVGLTVLIEITALKTILAVILLSRLMKSSSASDTHFLDCLEWCSGSNERAMILDVVSSTSDTYFLDCLERCSGSDEEFFISLRDFSKRFMRMSSLSSRDAAIC
nr:hypothetical protein [Tanacetum cinerariifolium]